MRQYHGPVPTRLIRYLVLSVALALAALVVAGCYEEDRSPVKAPRFVGYSDQTTGGPDPMERWLRAKLAFSATSIRGCSKIARVDLQLLPVAYPHFLDTRPNDTQFVLEFNRRALDGVFEVNLTQEFVTDGAKARVRLSADAADCTGLEDTTPPVQTVVAWSDWFSIPAWTEPTVPATTPAATPGARAGRAPHRGDALGFRAERDVREHRAERHRVRADGRESLQRRWRRRRDGGAPRCAFDHELFGRIDAHVRRHPNRSGGTVHGR